MKIAVIADDLTGAAEIGGIGLQFGFTVEIASQMNASTEADMLVINTDTRSKPLVEAVSIVTQVSEALKTMQPDFIYKKIDSVMRGHVMAEVNAQCHVMDYKRALIVPANPTLGRTLINGHYFINNVPVHQTSFAHDPEFPVTGSHVSVLLKSGNRHIHLCRPEDPLPQRGTIIGEVQFATDLDNWAKHITPGMLLAGAAGFFKACLNKLFTHKTMHHKHVVLQHPVLYVSGSTFGQSVSRIAQLNQDRGPVSYLRKEMLQLPIEQAIALWAEDASLLLKHYKYAVMAIRQDIAATLQPDAVYLRNLTARAVKKVFEHTPAKELVIEGGSTAAAILQELNISSIFPTQELMAGVVRNAVHSLYPGLYITLKPGSYVWTKEIWPF